MTRSHLITLTTIVALTVNSAGCSDDESAEASEQPWIAHQRQGPDGYGVHLIRPDGSGLHWPFADVPGGVQEHPTWSPDGDRLLFTVTMDDGTEDLWIGDVDGSDTEVLIDCVAPCIWVDEPGWDTTGEQIVFQRLVDSDAGIRSTLEVLHLDTGAIDLVSTAPSRTVYLAPAWSPDGTTMAVEVLSLPAADLEAEPTGDAIGVLDVATAERGVQLITEPTLWGNTPTWSPDGSMIVFTERDDPDVDQTNLFTIAPDGTSRVRLTSYDDPGESAIHPAFVPAGDRVIYSFLSGTTAPVMMTVTLDGSNRQRAAAIDSIGTHPRVQPA
jgi:Tol biopolymer transport system component